jgi:hypothetical protein
MDRAAGVDTKKMNTEYKLNVKLINEVKRSFDGNGETDRHSKLKGIRKKDHSFYKVTGNLWNESKFLNPKIARFSADNIDPMNCFKKTIRDLPKI